MVLLELHSDLKTYSHNTDPLPCHYFALYFACCSDLDWLSVGKTAKNFVSYKIPVWELKIPHNIRHCKYTQLEILLKHHNI